MIDSPPIRILDDLAARYEDETQAPLHEVLRTGLTEIIDQHFVDGQRFWPETEVCRKLNVSRMTVRRALGVLSDQGRLSRHRSRGTFVRKERERPKIDASTPVKSIGLFVPYLDSPFWSSIIDELAAVCSDTDRVFHAYACERGETGVSITAQLATDPSEEAILLLGNTHAVTKNLYSILTARGYRVVIIDAPIRGLPVPFVGVDNDMGIYIGVSHLAELGHKRITLLNYEPRENIVTQNRVDAFRSAVAEAGLTEATVFTVDLTIPGGSNGVIAFAMERIWAVPSQRPTALFTDSSGSSPIVLKWCAEHGIDVPDEVSILSFDDSRQVQFSRPPLTCIAQPLAAMARRAIALADHPENEHILLPPTLIVRASTRPPKTAC